MIWNWKKRIREPRRAIFSQTSQPLADYLTSLSPANGLTFNPATRILSGTPTASGSTQVTITTLDPGGLSASTRFSVVV